MMSDASKKKAEQKKAAATAKRGGKAATAATSSKAAVEASNGVEKVSDVIRSLYISDRTCTGVLYSHPQSRDIHRGSNWGPWVSKALIEPRPNQWCKPTWYSSACERQATHICGLYLQNILRQDIAFFDNETSSGQVIERMAGDTILIQDATGEKVGKCIQLVSTFFGSFIVAVSRGWLLTLVMLSSIPPVIIAGGAMSLMVSKLSSRGQKDYAEAGTVVEQTVGSIRTVVSFTGEKHAIENYTVKGAYQSAVHEGTVAGLGVGCVLFIIFSSYALAVWYGSQLIVHKGYSGGEVVNVMIAVMTGGMSLGQTSPCMSAFASGQAAAYKMIETINRKPSIDSGDMSGFVLENIKGNIELKDIYFNYPARPDHLIFDGFSLVYS